MSVKLVLLPTFVCRSVSQFCELNLDIFTLCFLLKVVDFRMKISNFCVQINLIEVMNSMGTYKDANFRYNCVSKS